MGLRILLIFTYQGLHIENWSSTHPYTQSTSQNVDCLGILLFCTEGIVNCQYNWNDVGEHYLLGPKWCKTWYPFSTQSRAPPIGGAKSTLKTNPVKKTFLNDISLFKKIKNNLSASRISSGVMQIRDINFEIWNWR